MDGATVTASERHSALRLGGVVLPCDPRLVSPTVAAAIRSGAYEAREARAIPGLVAPGDRVLEIGAGIGYISTLLARRAEVARVVAVEANPDLIPAIRETHRLNGVAGARVLNAVLAPGPARTVPFYQRDDFWMSSLSPGPEPYRAVVRTPTRDLDALVAEEAVSLIVCDVEGGEVGLFAGAALPGVDRVCLELHDHITGLRGIARVFADLARLGFAYDPRGSDGPVVLMRRPGDPEPPRAYAG